VCKGTYDDYLTHTQMPYHLANIRKNKFCLDIGKLCKRFTPLPAPKAKQPKSKPINKRNNCKRINEKAEELTNSDIPASV
jgi:hypothetical protein